MDNMTALVSCFARAYHCRNSNLPVFVDPVAEQMLTAEEYDTISRNMAQGIRYFAPGFKGTPEEALLFIVNHQLAPSVLARSGVLPGGEKGMTKHDDGNSKTASPGNESG